MPDGGATLPAGLPLAQLATLPRWVAWRTEPAPDTGRITKVPKSPRTRRDAASTRPEDWGTRDLAEAAHREIPPSRHGPGGVGVVLGAWPDGYAIGGVDLDTCRDAGTGALEPWAHEVLDLLNTYAEVSPSGTGVKAFFLMEPGAVAALREWRLLEPGGFGRAFRRGPARDHSPSIEPHLGGRYYTLTGERLPDMPGELRHVSTEALRRLLAEIGPAFKKGGARATGRASGADRSAAAFTLAKRVRAAGGDFRRFLTMLDADPDLAAWRREKGEASGGRELRRAWQRSAPASGDAAATAEMGPPEFSDDAVALAFSDRHADELLHVPEWGHWLRWDGARWARDTTLAVFDLARTICREQAGRAAQDAKDGAAWVTKIASAQKVAAVERLARADRRHARQADAFDADPWALNTPGGVVDLRTGQTRPHRREDHFTKIAGASPGGDCPAWRSFLREITHDDAALIAYLQRWAGYMLTGATREHAFLFAYGPGGNGKGVLMGTVAAMLGDYATTAPMETFMASQQDRHPTDLAGLRGARLVVAQETEAGRVLAEARIKALTGGDRISARFMRGDFFEFTPAFKLVMVGNHRPVIRNPDDAMRRRLHLLPLTYRPPRPDPNLPARLLAELPGILAWAIEGCMAWQRDGLGMPGAVRDATDSYFAEQDLLAQWLAERCEVKHGATAPSSALYRDWKEWSEARGEIAGTGKAFSAALERHHAKRKAHGTMVFMGVRLLPSDRGVW